MTGRVFKGSAKDLHPGDHVNLTNRAPSGVANNSVTGIVKEIRKTYMIQKDSVCIEGVIIVFQDDSEWVLSRYAEVKLLL